MAIAKNLKRSFHTPANIAIVACILWMGFEMFFGASLRNVSSKDALRQMLQGIDIGTSQEMVSSIIERNKTDRIRVRKDIFGKTWAIEMPFEFGAKDLVLYVQCGPDERVSAVAMRTSDGFHLEPPEDYPDKRTFHSLK